MIYIYKNIFLLYNIIINILLLWMFYLTPWLRTNASSVERIIPASYLFLFDMYIVKKMAQRRH